MTTLGGTVIELMQLAATSDDFGVPRRLLIQLPDGTLFDVSGAAPCSVEGHEDEPAIHAQALA